MEKKYSWRKLLNDLHLWLGIASGLVLFVVCLSGTIYTFRDEVEQLMAPDKYSVAVPAGAQPLAANVLVAKLERELGGNVVSLTIPEDNTDTYSVGIAAADGGKGGRAPSYFVNPYTGQVLGTTESATSEFFSTVMKLHRWLLLDSDMGRIIVGTATIIFLFMVLTGLVLWFPVKRKSWKQGLKIKTKAKWKRVNHDLHNTLGFYASLLLLVMALTGLCWSFGWYRDGLSAVMGAEVFKGRGEKPLSAAAPASPVASLTADDYIRKANQLLPYAGDLRLSLPADDTTAVVISKSRTGFFALAASDKVQLNQHTAAPLKVERFSEKPLNEQIVSLIKPLHLGNVYGTFSKILYFLACLIATSLPVTGTIIWLNKLKKKSKKQRPQRIMPAQFSK